MTGIDAMLKNVREEGLVLRLWQSGRELFHSNVLAYLLESPHFSAGLLQYLWGDDCSGFHVRALREQNGLDLLVLMLPVAPGAVHLVPEQQGYWDWLTSNLEPKTQARLLAIENKFKSLPDAAQLQGYSEALHDGTDPIARKPGWYLDHVWGAKPKDVFGGKRLPWLVSESKKVILTPSPRLSISVPVRITHSATTGLQNRSAVPLTHIQDDWVSRAWSDIARKIGALAPRVGGLEGSFIASYSRLLGAAIGLQQQILSHCEGKLPFAALDSARESAKRLRLADFVEKWRYESLTESVRARLAASGWEKNQVVRNARGLESQFRLPGPVAAVGVVGTFFSRGSGGTDIAIFHPNSPGFAIEVQLQGNTLKVMVALASGTESLQRDAVVAGIQALTKVSARIADVVAVLPTSEDLGSYTQVVGLTVRTDDKHPDHVNVLREDGRLLYARSTMWREIDSKSVGSWASLSTQQVAQRVADIAVDVAKYWDDVATAMKLHLPQLGKKATSHSVRR